MGLYKYSFKADDRETARAQAFDLDASYKDMSQVLRAMKGLSIKEARKVLDDIVSKKQPIAYKKFNKHMSHRSQLGGKKGRFPRKEAIIVLRLLKNAEANANYRGLNVDEMIVRQGAAYKQNVLRRYRRVFVNPTVLGYGKQALWANYVTCRAEITLSKGISRKAKRKQKYQKKKKV
ncbi:50S ribosomal protein L22 [Candidatus Micrarchaeota archaeon]|nr:50S ribosomal protein L22 [Candidatus Micrarchaeota archaeon]